MYGEMPFRPGVIADDTDLAAGGGALETDKVRWVRGRPQALGGWRTILSGVRGKARAMMEWASIEGRAMVAIGTSAKLYVYTGNDLLDITPMRSSGSFGNNPVSTTDGSSLVELALSSHGAKVGDAVYVGGLSAVAGLSLAGLSGTMASNPFTSQAGSRIVLVEHTAHGLSDGQLVKFASTTTFGGIPTGDMNRSEGLRVRVVNADFYKVEVATEATSSATGGGTPTYVYYREYVVTAVPDASTIEVDAGSAANATTTGGGNSGVYQFDIAIGLETGKLSAAGYGTGPYGAGPYGRSTTQTSTPLRPRLWSLAAWGEQLVANISGGAIYLWDGVASHRAAALSNAPAECNWIVVTPERFLLALGCTDFAGDFDPMLVRFASGTDLTVWTPGATNNAGSFRLGRGSRIVSGREARAGVVLQTDTAFYLVSFSAEVDQIYRADMLGANCGLLAPNAAVERDGSVFWITPGFQFYRYDGGRPQPMRCPVRHWFQTGLASGQQDKVFAAADSAHQAVFWLFPKAPGIECSAYVRVDLPEHDRDPDLGWANGTMARTAWTTGDGLAGAKPVAVGDDGVLYRHEDGYSADGEPMEWFVRWGPAQLEQGNIRTHTSRFVLDGELTEAAQVTFYAREYPNKAERQRGPIAISPDRRRVDLRITGRHVRCEISGRTSTFWRFGVLMADLSENSRR